MHNALQCVVKCMLQWITQWHMHIFAHLFISTFPILLVPFLQKTRAGVEGGEPGDVCQGLVHPDLQAWHILCPWDLQNRQAVCICWWLGGAEWKWWGPASITTPAWVCSTHYLVRGWRRWDRYRVDGEEIKTTNDEEPSSYQNQQVGQVYVNKSVDYIKINPP